MAVIGESARVVTDLLNLLQQRDLQIGRLISKVRDDRDIISQDKRRVKGLLDVATVRLVFAMMIGDDTMNSSDVMCASRHTRPGHRKAWRVLGAQKFPAWPIFSNDYKGVSRLEICVPGCCS